MSSIKSRFSRRARRSLPRLSVRPEAGPQLPPEGRHLFQPDSADITIKVPLGHDGFGVLDLDQALSEIDGTPRVVVHSPGGDVYSGLALAERLHAVRAAVCAYHAESAAVLLVIAGHSRSIAANGWFGVHESWTALAGGRRHLSAAAERCAAIDRLLAESLSRWSRLTFDQAVNAMKEGKVWTAQKAYDDGLVDHVGPAVQGIGQRPDQLVDTPAREAYTLRTRADATRMAAAYQRARAEASTCHSATPAFAELNNHTAAYEMEAAVPPERLAGIFDSAGGHARRQGGPQRLETWTPRWTCHRCGILNFHPPAHGFNATACINCNQAQGEPSDDQ